MIHVHNLHNLCCIYASNYANMQMELKAQMIRHLNLHGMYTVQGITGMYRVTYTYVTIQYVQGNIHITAGLVLRVNTFVLL